MNNGEITVTGTLGGDPELSFGKGGGAFCSFSLAVSHRYQKNGEWVEETTWYSVKAFRDLAENAAASLAKGNRVTVSGRLKVEEWEAKDGTKRKEWRLIADDIAASLRWARVEIERIAREQPSGQRSGRRDEPVYGDEEPF